MDDNNGYSRESKLLINAHNVNRKATTFPILIPGLASLPHEIRNNVKKKIVIRARYSGVSEFIIPF